MTLLLGSHVEGADPVQGALLRSAEVVQINLTSPRVWAPPKSRKDAEDLLKWKTPIYVHAPYLVNPASLNPKVRAQSKLALQKQAEAAYSIGALGLVVHGGHPTGSGTVQDGVNGWAEVLSDWVSPVPLLIENTAGGKAAVARSLDSLSYLWPVILKTGNNIGYCLDTCHSFCGGQPLDNLVFNTKEIVGSIDLVHVNNAKDSYNSSRDRHANLLSGTIDPNWILEVVKTADTHSIVETPGGPAAQAEDIKWLKEGLNV